MKLPEARALFKGAIDKVFLDSACVGLAPISARSAINDFMTMVVECPAKDISEHHIAMDAMKSTAINEAALLFNTEVENVSLIESTTHGLNIACNSIPFSSNDEVIVANIEYLQVAIPFVKKHQAKRLTLVPLQVGKNGHIALSDFQKIITNKTKAICLSAVQWCTGQKVFTKALSDLCASNGIWLIIDGVQEAGALNIDVNLRDCDFYIAGGHKWLNAPYGCGIMCMSKRAQQLEPPSYGYLNLSPPKEGWGTYFQNPTQTPFRDYQFPKSARSFGIGGTGNYPGSIGLLESLKIINHVGPKNIENRVLQLSAFLKNELTKNNIRVFSLSDPESCSGITIFRIFDSYEQDLKALNHLLNKRIFLSIRYTNSHGGLRASTHYFNNEEEILKLCHEIKLMRQ